MALHNNKYVVHPMTFIEKNFFYASDFSSGSSSYEPQVMYNIFHIFSLFLGTISAKFHRKYFPPFFYSFIFIKMQFENLRQIFPSQIWLFLNKSEIEFDDVLFLLYFTFNKNVKFLLVELRLKVGGNIAVDIFEYEVLIKAFTYNHSAYVQKM